MCRLTENCHDHRTKKSLDLFNAHLLIRINYKRPPLPDGDISYEKS